MKKIIPLLILLFIFKNVNAQYYDPAQTINMMKLQNNEGTYIRIGAYKVKGSPLLYFDHFNGKIFSGNNRSESDKIGFNTYDQSVEIGSNKESFAVGTIDSFYMKISTNTYDIKTLNFVYSYIVGDSSQKVYYNNVIEGTRYNLYKLYTTELSTNSASFEADLRIFKLVYSYYYKDNTTGKFKKLKTSYSGLTKEFKNVSGIKDNIPVDFSVNPEAALIMSFTFLNK